MSNSDETRIALLENNYENMDKKLDGILERFNNFENKLDIALGKKADKDTQWAEKLLIWLGIFIGGGLLAWLGTLIIKLINL